MTLRIVWLAVFVVATGAIQAKDRLTLRVSPYVSFAPANLVARTMIEANEGNRSILIVAESDDFYRSSEMQLDGAKAPRTSIFEFRSMPKGTYDVRAFLKGSDGQAVAVAQQRVNVVESGKGDR